MLKKRICRVIFSVVAGVCLIKASQAQVVVACPNPGDIKVDISTQEAQLPSSETNDDVYAGNPGTSTTLIATTKNTDLKWIGNGFIGDMPNAYVDSQLDKENDGYSLACMYSTPSEASLVILTVLFKTPDADVKLVEPVTKDAPID